jgi:hypothetical protein
MRHRPVCAGVIAAIAAVAACGCSGDDGGSAQPAGSSSPSTSAPVESVVVRGSAALDGAPFDAEFLGAAVRDHGLITPCQATLPQVEQGRYEIEVLSIAAASGCGAPDSEVLFWTFTNDTQYFSTEAFPWPADGQPTNFDIGFVTATPEGAAPRMTEFAGEVFEQDGRQLPDGTRVEARIGNALCGVASVRTSGDFTGFSLAVVGPESIAGCDAGATVTFRADGRPATTTAVNDFRADPSLDLMLPEVGE